MGLYILSVLANCIQGITDLRKPKQNRKNRAENSFDQNSFDRKGSTKTSLTKTPSTKTSPPKTPSTDSV